MLGSWPGAVHPEAKDGAVCPAAMAQPVVNSPETGWAQKLKKLKGRILSLGDGQMTLMAGETTQFKIISLGWEMLSIPL